MATNTDIANRALSRLSQTQIASIDDQTIVPGIVRTHFAPLRQEMLRSHPWNFAIRREPLARTVNAPRFGPLYEFLLPPNYLMTVAAFVDMEAWCKIDRYSIENNLFLGSMETANLLYVEDKEDPTDWDPSFTSAFVVQLAARLCMPIKGDAQMAQALLQEALQVEIPEAMLYNAREDTSNENSPVAEFINGATINRVSSGFYGWGFRGFDLSNVNTTF